MSVTIRTPRPGDGAEMARVWLSAAAYYTLLVDQPMWHQGAGTALLTAAEEWGRDRGAEGQASTTRR